VSILKWRFATNNITKCHIFDKDQSVISRHINNIFKDNEVDEIDGQTQALSEYFDVRQIKELKDLYDR
jgi:hypothetical protein